MTSDATADVGAMRVGRCSCRGRGVQCLFVVKEQEQDVCHQKETFIACVAPTSFLALLFAASAVKKETKVCSTCSRRSTCRHMRGHPGPRYGQQTTRRQCSAGKRVSNSNSPSLSLLFVSLQTFPLGPFNLFFVPCLSLFVLRSRSLSVVLSRFLRVSVFLFCSVFLFLFQVVTSVFPVSLRFAFAPAWLPCTFPLLCLCEITVNDECL